MRERKKKTRQYQAVAPVLTRRKSAPPLQSGKRKRRKKPTSQLYHVQVEMTVPLRRGAARYLPSLTWEWSPRFALRAAFIALVMILAALLVLPQFRVQQAEVLGAQRLSAADINLVLDVQSHPVFLLNTTHLRQKLLDAYPSLADVQVTRHWYPAALTVSLVEREPVWALKQDGALYWVDAQGVVFPARGQAEALQPIVAFSPLIESGDASLSPEMLQALATITPFLPDGAVVIYDAQHGLGWTTREGVRIFLGRHLGDVALKVRLTEAVQTALQTRGLRPSLIDVSCPDAPYYRLDD